MIRNLVNTLTCQKTYPLDLHCIQPYSKRNGIKDMVPTVTKYLSNIVKGLSAMEKLKWEATFSIRPGVTESEIHDGYHFKLDKNGNTVVKREYITSSYTEKHPNSNNPSEYAEQTLLKQDIQIIRNILLKRMIYQKNFSPISVGLSEALKLVNKETLQKTKSLGIRTVSHLHTTSYSILEFGNTFDESQLFWDQGFSRTHLIKQQDELLRISNWIEKSYTEKDEIQSFILAWIAFNGLYGLACSLADDAKKKDFKNNEYGKYNFTISELCTEIEANRIMQVIGSNIEKLANFNITSGYGKFNCSENLKEQLAKKDTNNIESLKRVADCIHGVRNQVFHEAPSTLDVLDRVKAAKLALLPILECCLKAFVSSDGLHRDN